MNDSMHDLLVKVRIIGKIRENQKLDVQNGLNVVNADSWSAWLYRKITRENKHECTRFLRDLYRSLEQSVDILINEMKRSKDEVKKSKLTYVMINVAIDIKNSIKGLDFLSKSYTDFPSTTAAIEGIIRDYVIVIYNSLLENIPKDKLTDQLKEPIIYMGAPLYELSGTDTSRLENLYDAHADKSHVDKPRDDKQPTDKSHIDRQPTDTANSYDASEY
jgi:hypothetical protein